MMRWIDFYIFGVLRHLYARSGLGSCRPATFENGLRAPSIQTLDQNTADHECVVEAIGRRGVVAYLDSVIDFCRSKPGHKWSPHSTSTRSVCIWSKRKARSRATSGGLSLSIVEREV